MDYDRNGKIEYSEFITACSNLSNLMTHKNLKEAFNLFDLNGDGQIEPRELKSVLGTKDSDLSDETWELLIKEFDSNNDG